MRLLITYILSDASMLLLLVPLHLYFSSLINTPNLGLFSSMLDELIFGDLVSDEAVVKHVTQVEKHSDIITQLEIIYLKLIHTKYISIRVRLTPIT